MSESREERIEDLPKQSDAKGLLGNEYKEALKNMELAGIIASREFKNGQPGANATLLMRPGQFCDEEWAEAEKRAQGAS